MNESLDPIPWQAHSGTHLQLSEKVAMHLREQIVSGQIAPGSFIRIENIAKSLDVSMTPVREGLLLLQSEALVRLIPRRGFQVHSFNKQDLIDLFWTQASIGAELARRAATRISDEEIERLQTMQDDYEASIKDGNEQLTGKLGHQFHRSVNIAAESPRLASMLGSLTRQLPNRFYAGIEGQLHLASQYHPMILSAFRLRDTEAAGSLMFRHINDGGKALVDTLEKRGLWDRDQAPAKGSRRRA